MISTRIVAAALDTGVASAWLHETGGKAGAVVQFSGVVRGENATVSGLYLEHYPGMSERVLAALAERVAESWDVHRLLAWHRVGEVQVGEVIVIVGAAASHRQEAFEAAACLMDLVKTGVPLWKKLTGPAGSEWAEAREQDVEAAARWQNRLK